MGGPFSITLTKIVQTSLIISVGDGFAQFLEAPTRDVKEFRSKFNYTRNAQMVAFGIANNGIAVPMWLRMMWKHFGGGRDPLTVGKKILLDQTVYAPVVVGSVLLYTSVCKELNKPNALNGPKERVNSVMDEFEVNLKEKALEIYLYDCAVWPAASLLNYRYLPERFMVSFYAIVTVGWNCYLSYRSWSDDGKSKDVCVAGAIPIATAEGGRETPRKV